MCFVFFQPHYDVKGAGRFTTVIQGVRLSTGQSTVETVHIIESKSSSYLCVFAEVSQRVFVCVPVAGTHVALNDPRREAWDF